MATELNSNNAVDNSDNAVENSNNAIDNSDSSFTQKVYTEIVKNCDNATCFLIVDSVEEVSRGKDFVKENGFHFIQLLYACHVSASRSENENVEGIFLASGMSFVIWFVETFSWVLPIFSFSYSSEGKTQVEQCYFPIRLLDPFLKEVISIDGKAITGSTRSPDLYHWIFTLFGEGKLLNFYLFFTSNYDL